MIRPLLEIINTTMKNGIFPLCLKKSTVKLIFKKGTTDDVDNYRPITLVPAMSLILEKIVAKQLVSFLDKHNIINYSQFAFRKNKSTKDAIAFMVDNII
jgi:potassium voltage-gated channel Eag-related subfamily H protein 8